MSNFIVGIMVGFALGWLVRSLLVQDIYIRPVRKPSDQDHGGRA